MAEGLQGSSRTAALTAAARAFHREEPPPWVLDDPLALDLAGDDGRQLLERLRSDLPRDSALAFSRWVAVRARYVEDVVEAAAGRGVEQYVILGAGLDSFAYRRADLLDRVRVFEVDHPATQEATRARLHELGIRRPDRLVFVPVDFERQQLREQLVASGYALDRPAVVSWIGVTMYLTREAIDSTLAALAGFGAATRVVLTYNQPRSVLPDWVAEIGATFSALAAELGERFVSLFTPEEIEAVMVGHGFVDVTHFGPDEALTAYFGGRPDVLIAGAQRILSASVPGGTVVTPRV